MPIWGTVMTMKTRKWSRIARCLLLSVAIFGYLACGSGEEETAIDCRLNSDCQLGRVCRNGSCDPGCDGPLDCPPSETCVLGSCVSPGGQGGGNSGSSGGVDPGPWSQCDECLETECGVAEKNCGPNCRAIEACIETICAHLSELGSADEGPCFVQCQSEHAAGKEQHVTAANCANDTKCQPPCTFYPQDYDLCRTFMTNGDCAAYSAACEASLSCKSFRQCIETCSSLQDCLACDDSSAGTEGRALLEAFETCIATECLSESWIP